MKNLVVTSPGLLLIFAIIVAGGIFLLDAFYLQPRAAVQQEAAVHERGLAAQTSAELTVHCEEDRLVALASAIADQIVDHVDLNAPNSAAQLARHAGRLLEEDEQIVVTDRYGGVRLSWSANEETPLPTDLSSGVSPAAMRGLLRLEGQLAVFGRRPLSPHPDIPETGHVWVFARMSGPLSAKINSATSGTVIWIAADSLPGMGENGRQMWQSGKGKVTVAWPARDSQGEMAGFFRADLSVANIYQQGAAARRIVLSVLALSAGLTLLIITGVHMLITGPVVRLLKRVRQIEKGEISAENLCRNLHGEPRLLAGQLQTAFDRMAQMSQTDELTGLANRRHFEQALESSYEQARRYNRRLSLMAMDIDFFKAVNDTSGHEAGDAALVALAEALRGGCRGVDLPARIGGDEFSVLMPETSASEAAVLANRIRQAVGEYVVSVQGAESKITLSMGVTDLNAGPISSPEDMVKLADRALYAAKQQGRDRVVQAHDLSDRRDQSSDSEAQQIEQLRSRLAGLDDQFKETFLTVADRFTEALAARDPRRCGHAGRVRRYASLLAGEMQLPDHMVHRLEIAASMHDVGMVALPDSVLLADGPLTDEQLELYRRHPLLSVRVMEGLDFLEQEIPTVRYHHERYDGKGYPEGLAGAEIPLTARILSVADVFDGLMCLRDARRTMGQPEALKELQRVAGGQLDPAIVEVFCALADRLGDDLLQDGPAETPSSTDPRWRDHRSGSPETQRKGGVGTLSARLLSLGVGRPGAPAPITLA